MIVDRRVDGKTKSSVDRDVVVRLILLVFFLLFWKVREKEEEKRGEDKNIRINKK